jgi:hypothetical protein
VNFRVTAEIAYRAAQIVARSVLVLEHFTTCEHLSHQPGVLS